jgi:hypothetical protein
VLHQLHGLDGGQGDGDFSFVVTCGPEIHLVGSDVRVYAQGYSHHFGLSCGGDANQLVVSPGIPQQGDDVLVGHLDSPVSGTHNLDFVLGPRHEDD